MFIGVDQSLNSTGVCVLDPRDRDDTPTACRPLTRGPRLHTLTPGDARGAERLGNIFHKLLLVIPRAWEHSVACLEGGSYGSNGQLFQLGQVSGLVQVALRELGYQQIIEIPPQTLKTFAIGRANADKEDMIEAARQAGVSPDNDDEADAFHLARIAEMIGTVEKTSWGKYSRGQLEIWKSVTEVKKSSCKKRLTRVRNAV